MDQGVPSTEGVGEMSDQDRYEYEVSSEQWELEQLKRDTLEWESDPVAQKEYQEYLRTLEVKNG